MHTRTRQGLYRFKSQGPSSKLFGIIGNPVHHSKSPLIHNSAFAHIGAFAAVTGCAEHLLLLAASLLLAR